MNAGGIEANTQSTQTQKNLFQEIIEEELQAVDMSKVPQIFGHIITSSKKLPDPCQSNGQRLILNAASGFQHKYEILGVVNQQRQQLEMIRDHYQNVPAFNKIQSQQCHSSIFQINSEVSHETSIVLHHFAQDRYRHLRNFERTELERIIRNQRIQGTRKGHQ